MRRLKSALAADPSNAHDVQNTSATSSKRNPSRPRPAGRRWRKPCRKKNLPLTFASKNARRPADAIERPLEAKKREPFPRNARAL